MRAEAVNIQALANRSDQKRVLRIPQRVQGTEWPNGDRDLDVPRKIFLGEAF